MTTSRNPFRLNVGFFFNQARGTFRDFPYDIPGFELSPDLSTRQVTGNVRISRTSEGLLLQGDFQTHVAAACVRCLEDFEQPLHSEFTELYTFPKQLDYVQPAEDDPELVVPEDGYIDLAPLLAEYLLLEIPIKPLHDPNCRGLCPECGANWNETTCIHQTDTIAPTQISSE